MNSSFVFSFTVCKLYLFFVDSFSLWLLFVYTQVDPSSAVFFPTNRKKDIINPSHIVRKKLQKEKITYLPYFPWAGEREHTIYIYLHKKFLKSLSPTVQK